GRALVLPLPQPLPPPAADLIPGRDGAGRAGAPTAAPGGASGRRRRHPPPPVGRGIVGSGPGPGGPSSTVEVVVDSSGGSLVDGGVVGPGRGPRGRGTVGTVMSGRLQSGPRRSSSTVVVVVVAASSSVSSSPSLITPPAVLRSAGTSTDSASAPALPCATTFRT